LNTNRSPFLEFADHAIAMGLAVATGFGVAVAANLLLFRACQSDWPLTRSSLPAGAFRVATGAFTVLAAPLILFWAFPFVLVDRTYQDGIWLDPTGTVSAWVYLAPRSTAVPAAPGPRLVSANLQDVDRARWLHGRRRTSHGDRIADLIRDRTLTR
jgi:hypothetical protein